MERPFDEKMESSSDTDGLHTISAKKRRYIQKFRKSWFSDPRLSNWIAQVSSNEVKCKYCDRGIKCKLSSLLRHGETNKHITAAESWKYNKQECVEILPDTGFKEESLIAKVERTVDEGMDSSSDTDSFHSSSINKSKYTQKFRKSWFNDSRLSDWIIEVNKNEVKCKYCDQKIECKISSLLNHGKTNNHIAAAETWNSNNQKIVEILPTIQLKQKSPMPEIERSLNEEVESDSGTDDFHSPSANKRKYTQKFRKCWFNDPRLSNWIVEVSNEEVKCKYCDRLIKCKLSSLLSHRETNKHITAAETWKSNNPTAVEISADAELKQELVLPKMERTLDEEVDSSSDTHDSDSPITGKRKYEQKFKKSWFCDPRLSNWIVEINNKEVKCKYCDREIQCKLSSLLRHAETNKHIRAAETWKSDHQKTAEISSDTQLKEESLLSNMERTMDEELDSSSDTDDFHSLGVNKRKYTQKFRKCWFSDPRLSNWIVKVSNKEVKCKYCDRLIKCKLSSLLSHGETNKHMTAAETWKSGDQKTPETSPKTHQPLERAYSSSDTEEDSDLPSTSEREYNHKPGKRWFSDPRIAEWIIEINDKKVKCIYCHCLIRSKLYNVLRHRKTSKHIAAAPPIKNKKQKLLEFYSRSMAALNPDLSKPTCRVCLQNNDNEMCSIFDVDEDFNIFIYEKIEQCAGIKVLRHEKMPTLICSDCFGVLKVSFKFRTICRNSNEYLKEFVLVGKENEKMKMSNKENPLLISENSYKTEVALPQGKPKTNQSLSTLSPDVKNESFSHSNSPNNPINFIEENLDDNGDEMWLDIDYHDDGEHFEVSIDQIDVDIKEEAGESNQSKKNIKPRKKSAKEKKSTKTLEISSDGAAIIREKNPPVKREKKEKQPHICEICGNIYPKRYSLEVHMRRHRDEKPYECEICAYAFHSNFELIRHMRKHTGSRPYKCSYCPRAFGDQSTLIKHERIHRNERPFKCETCGKSFTYSNVLKYHKYVHTGEKPYACELCGKCFTRPHHLRAHLETLQHQSDPRSKILIQNIRKNNDDDSFRVNTSTLKV